MKKIKKLATTIFSKVFNNKYPRYIEYRCGFFKIDPFINFNFKEAQINYGKITKIKEGRFFISDNKEKEAEIMWYENKREPYFNKYYDVENLIKKEKFEELEVLFLDPDIRARG